MKLKNMFVKDSIESKINNLIEPAMASLGYEVVRILYAEINGLNTLQVMLDRIDGEDINVDDCSKASGQISAILDVEDPIADKYNLEISSPGIDRPLTRKKDFAKYKDYEVKIKTIEKVGEKRRITGKLLGLEDDMVLVNIEGEGLIKINFENIKSAKLVLTDDLLKRVND